MKKMMLYRNTFLGLLQLVIFHFSFSQTIDSTRVQPAAQPVGVNTGLKQNIPGYFISPAILTGLGSIDPGRGGLLNINSYSQHTTQVHWKPGNSAIDNYFQFLPAAGVYALDAFSVKPQHSFWQRNKIFIAGNILMALGVSSLKNITHVERPDKSDFRSFPSGHAATAFLGADFFYQEFRYKRKWWTYSGYFIATAVGAYRVLNNKHWITDVIAGAGFGILANRISYIVLDKKKAGKRK